MAEQVKKEKPKQEAFEYKLLSHGDKLSMILENMFNMEQALFMHNMNRLAEDHSDYASWRDTEKEIKQEIMRLRYVYENMGGNWENTQEYDEYGEPI